MMTSESATEWSGLEETEKNKIETSKEKQEEDPEEGSSKKSQRSQATKEVDRPKIKRTRTQTEHQKERGEKLNANFTIPKRCARNTNKQPKQRTVEPRSESESNESRPLTRSRMKTVVTIQRAVNGTSAHPALGTTDCHTAAARSWVTISWLSCSRPLTDRPKPIFSFFFFFDFRIHHGGLIIQRKGIESYVLKREEGQR